MRHRRISAKRVFFLTATVSLGCQAPPEAAGPAQAATQPVAASRPGADEPLAYDPAKAFLTLAELQPAIAKPEPKPASDKPAPAQAVRRLVAGRKLFNEQRYTEAVLELEKALRYLPDDARIHALLALACQQSGNEGRAAVHTQKALAANPDSVVGHYLQGTHAIALEQTEDAIRALRTALLCSDAKAENAYTALAYYRLAGALHTSGYLTAAIEAYRAFEALTAEPTEASLANAELAGIVRVAKGLPAQRIGEAYLTLGQTAAAADALGRASQAKPSDPKLRIRHGQTLIRAKRYDAAVAVARELVREFPGLADGMQLLVQAHAAAGNPTGATADLQRLAAEHADNVPLALALADTLAKQGQRGAAIKALREVTARQPDQLEPYWKLAALLGQDGKIDAALQVLAQAVLQDEDAHGSAAEHARKLAQQSAATKTFLTQFDDHLAKANEKDGYAYGFLLGIVAAAAAQPAQAERAFDAVVAAREGFVPAHLALARLQLARFQWQRAIATVKRAQQADPNLHTLERLLGQAYDGLDEHEQAIVHYQAALKHYPRDTKTLLHLAKLADRTGNANQAKQKYIDILRLDPRHVEAREALFRLYLLGREVKNARLQLEALRSEGGPPAVVGRCAALLSHAAGQASPEAFRAALTELLADHGDNAATRLELAGSFWREFEYDKVIEQIEAAQKLGPLPVEGEALLAYTLSRQLRYDECRTVYERLVARHPNRESWIVNGVHDGYYHLLRIEQNYEKAAAVLEALLQRKTVRRRGERESWLLLTLQRMGQNEAAVERARAWHEKTPDDADRRGRLVAALQRAEKLDEAIGLVRNWLDAAPADVATRRLFLRVLAAAERTDEAQQWVLDWLADDPDGPVVDFLRMIFTSSERYDDAIEWVRNAEALAAAGRSPTQRQAAWNMKRYALLPLYQLAKRDDEAIALLESMSATPALPASVKLQLEDSLGRVLLSAKRYADAEAHLRGMLEQLPESAAAGRAAVRQTLSFVFQQSGRKAAAEAQLVLLLKDATKGSTSYVGTSNDLGYTWVDAGKNVAQGEAMIRFAVGQQPDQAAYLDSLGWARYKRGDYAGAKKWLGRATNALDLNTLGDPLSQSDDPVIIDHLGDALWRLGEHDAATEQWTKAIDGLRKRTEGARHEDQAVLAQAEKKVAAAQAGTAPPVADVLPAASERNPETN